MKSWKQAKKSTGKNRGKKTLGKIAKERNKGEHSESWLPSHLRHRRKIPRRVERREQKSWNK